MSRAAALVAEETRLPWSGEPAVAVVTRAEWARANVASFERLLAPAEAKLAASGAGLGGRLSGRLLGAEVGALVGFLARRVLGQYELVVPSGDGGGDTVMLVGGNLLALERLHEFRPAEFRLWVALHECTHRLQFTAVPWMRPYFLGLVSQLVEASAAEAGRVSRLAGELRAAAGRGRPLLDETGVMGLLATPAQREVIDRVQALMSFLEGHGHVVMDRIGGRLLVTQQRMSRVLKARRRDPRHAAFSQADRPGDEDAAVRAGGALHPGGGAPRRLRRPRPRLGGARPPAHPRGDPGAGAMAAAGGLTPGSRPPERGRRAGDPAAVEPGRVAACRPAPVLVALGGGADSAAAAPGRWRRAGRRVRAATVDHGLPASPVLIAAAQALAAAPGHRAPPPSLRRAGALRGGPARRPLRRPGSRGRARARSSPPGTPPTTRPRPCWATSSAAPAPGGLSGIPERRGRWCRPLLDLSREEVRAAADDLGLPYADDPGNADLSRRRNVLRHEVLPLLEERLGPGVRVGPAPGRRPAGRRRRRTGAAGRRRARCG